MAQTVQVVLQHPEDVAAKGQMGLRLRSNRSGVVLVRAQRQSKAQLVCSSGDGELLHMGILLEGSFRVTVGGQHGAAYVHRFVFMDRTKRGVQLLAGGSKEDLLHAACRLVASAPRLHFCLSAHKAQALAPQLVEALQQDLCRTFVLPGKDLAGFAAPTAAGGGGAGRAAGQANVTNCCMFAMRIHALLNPRRPIQCIPPPPPAVAGLGRAAAPAAARGHDAERGPSLYSDDDAEDSVSIITARGSSFAKSDTHSTEDGGASSDASEPHTGMASKGSAHSDSRADSYDGDGDDEPDSYDDSSSSSGVSAGGGSDWDSDAEADDSGAAPSGQLHRQRAEQLATEENGYEAAAADCFSDYNDGYEEEEEEEEAEPAEQEDVWLQEAAEEGQAGDEDWGEVAEEAAEEEWGEAAEEEWGGAAKEEWDEAAEGWGEADVVEDECEDEDDDDEVQVEEEEEEAEWVAPAGEGADAAAYEAEDGDGDNDEDEDEEAQAAFRHLMLSRAQARCARAGRSTGDDDEQHRQPEAQQQHGRRRRRRSGRRSAERRVRQRAESGCAAGEVSAEEEVDLYE